MAKQIGIDLGTSNTMIYLKDKGIVLRAPSVVALDRTTQEVIASGTTAKRMVGKTPGNILALCPLWTSLSSMYISVPITLYVDLSVSFTALYRKMNIEVLILIAVELCSPACGGSKQFKIVYAAKSIVAVES